MQEFENIQSLWQSHSAEVKISSEEMLGQVKKEVNAIRSKSLLNIGGMVISFLAISSLLIFFDFNSWTTPLGIGIIIAAVAVCTFLLYREHQLIANNDFTEHPAAFLSKLHQYQLSRSNLYNRLYWFYTLAISFGFILYFFEMLDKMQNWMQIAFILFTILWMAFCATILRKSYMKKEKERIDLLIEKFERISAQFKEQV